MAGTTFWGRFENDPRRAENAHLRAADADRDLVNELIGAAYSDGRLDREEFDERADRVAQAKTLGQLPDLVADLVSTSGSVEPRPSQDHRAEAERRFRQSRQQALGAFLLPTLICWVVWLSVSIGHGHPTFPWPIFVTLGTGMRFFQLTFNRQDTIASIEQHLVRREQRRLEQRERRERRIQGHLPPAYPPDSSSPPRPLDAGPPPRRGSGGAPPPPWQH